MQKWLYEILLAHCSFCGALIISCSFVEPCNVISVYFFPANLPYLVQDMPDELNTDLVGNPRVYVSKLPSGRPSVTGWEHLNVYINNAKVIDANHEAISSRGMKQVRC